MTDSSNSVGITIDSNGVATVTMNRPQQRNAMSADLVTGMIGLLRTLDQDSNVRAILIIGAGNGFCAGSDLAGLASWDADGRRRFEEDSGTLARLIPHLSKPVVAAAKGFAIGGGLTLAVACDVVVTNPTAKWSLPEVPIGLFPAWGLAAVQDRIGRPAARRLSWGIDTLSGTEAHRVGLADVLTDGDVIKEALAIATRLAALPAAQSASVKRYFAQGLDDTAADALANQLFLQGCTSPEAAATFIKFGK